MRILCFCVARGINISALESHLKDIKLPFKKFSDVLCIKGNNQHGPQWCFYLKNGTIILWNTTKSEANDYIAHALPFCNNKLKTYLRDRYCLLYGDKIGIRPHKYFNVDILTIPKDDFELVLALTYAFTLTIKLTQHEKEIEDLIEKYTPIINRLALTGKIDISRHAASKIIGEIMETKSLVNLKGFFAYPPQFFWNHPALESHYFMMEQYLDITKRRDILNHRLDTLSEVYAMLDGYLQNKHSHFLEVVVILLITIEVLTNVFRVHLM